MSRFIANTASVRVHAEYRRLVIKLHDAEVVTLPRFFGWLRLLPHLLASTITVCLQCLMS